MVALRVVLDAAVERIREPNLPRIRQDHQSIPFEASKSIAPTTVKLSKTNGRLRPAIGSGLSRRPKCKWGPSEGPVFPSFAMGVPAFTASPTFTVMLPWLKCAYQAKTFGAISRITLLPP